MISKKTTMFHESMTNKSISHTNWIIVLFVLHWRKKLLSLSWSRTNKVEAFNCCAHYLIFNTKPSVRVRLFLACLNCVFLLIHRWLIIRTLSTIWRPPQTCLNFGTFSVVIRPITLFDSPSGYEKRLFNDSCFWLRHSLHIIWGFAATLSPKQLIRVIIIHSDNRHLGKSVLLVYI